MIHSFYFSCSFMCPSGVWTCKNSVNSKLKLPTSLTWLFSVNKLICAISDNSGFCYSKTVLYLSLCNNNVQFRKTFAWSIFFQLSDHYCFVASIRIRATHARHNRSFRQYVFKSIVVSQRALQRRWKHSFRVLMSEICRCDFCCVIRS